ncbi:MAG TPA: tetratricopeptide repeat protein [Bryobacteraceae bacterium]|nr:tetratricopeptide repeat protein [Bryobacteraceae bacterium]
MKRRLLAGDRVEARETARELLARVVADPQALLNLGQLLGTHQELALAEQAFRQAVRLDPDSYAAQFNLGLTLYQEGKPRDAAEPLLRAVDLQSSFEANYLLGVVLSDLGRGDDAIRRLRKSRTMRPQHKGTLALLGVLYVGGGYPLDAVDVLEEAARLDPSDRKVALLLVEACHESFNFAKALATARSAAARFPDAPEAQFRLGYELETGGAFEESRQAFQKAVALRPGYLEAEVALGRLERKAGSYAEAVKQLQAVLRTDPKHFEGRLELSKAFVGSRDLSQARPILVELTEEKPDDPAPHALLAQVYAARREPQLAARERDRYLALSRRSTLTGGMGGAEPGRRLRRFVP